MAGPFNRSVTKTITTTAPTQTHIAFADSQTWYTSSRDPSGHLNLLPQVYTRRQRQVLAYNREFTPGWAPVVLAPANRMWASSAFNREQVLATNAAYHWLIQKINNDASASLGVSLSQWNQTWTMIDRRFSAIGRFAKKLYRPPRPRPPYRIIRQGGRVLRVRNEPRMRRGVEYGSSADAFLEGIFGWLPAVNDMFSAAQELASDVPYGWIVGRGSQDGTRSHSDANQRMSAFSRWQVAQSLRVDRVNPNGYLLNQLGLINPAVVAWDIVPWSFVVGWFGNFQAVLSSYSDLYGINYSYGNVTVRERYWDTQWRQNTYPASHPGYASSSKSYREYSKSRSVGGVAHPSLVFRMPKLTMTRSLISASLATQQIRRLSTSQ